MGCSKGGTRETRVGVDVREVEAATRTPGRGPGGSGADGPPRLRTRAAFWVLGLCNNYGYVVMISAAYDILHKNFLAEARPMPGPRQCNYLSTGAILLADILPSLVIKFLSPFLPLWINLRMSVVVVNNVLGFLLVAFASELWVALAGVAAMSLAQGLGEASLLAYTAFFKDKSVVTMWSSGTGAAGVLGAVSYLGLTTLLSPRDALLIMNVVPAAVALAFWVLLVRPRIDVKEDKAVKQPDKVRDGVPMFSSTASFVDKLGDIPPLFKYIFPLFAVYLFEYFINQGLYELIRYESEWLTQAQQYKMFQALYQIGVFVSRTSGGYVPMERTWILAVLQGLNVVYFTLEAVYRMSGSVWVVAVLVVWEGLLGGAAYVRTFFCISTKVVPEKREFSMAMSSVADALGIFTAGLVAIPAHNLLCQLPAPS
ncbi:battenin-like isoform X3 [Thrips palmi]|uniref:Battenin n=1 Tax=Thrips palmi TaxID=161013 RepID=A0A6P8YDL3_THRPL|nr:battenin-like isoform X3 [Thrips palmi]